MPGTDAPDDDAAVTDCDAVAGGASGSYIATISNSVNPNDSPITNNNLDKKPINSAPFSGLDYLHCNPRASAKCQKTPITKAVTAALNP